MRKSKDPIVRKKYASKVKKSTKDSTKSTKTTSKLRSKPSPKLRFAPYPPLPIHVVSTKLDVNWVVAKLKTFLIKILNVRGYEFFFLEDNIDHPGTVKILAGEIKEFGLTIRDTSIMGDLTDYLDINPIGDQLLNLSLGMGLDGRPIPTQMSSFCLDPDSIHDFHPDSQPDPQINSQLDPKPDPKPDPQPKFHRYSTRSSTRNLPRNSYCKSKSKPKSKPKPNPQPNREKIPYMIIK